MGTNANGCAKQLPQQKAKLSFRCHFYQGSFIFMSNTRIWSYIDTAERIQSLKQSCKRASPRGCPLFLRVQLTPVQVQTWLQENCGKLWVLQKIRSVFRKWVCSKQRCQHHLWNNWLNRPNKFSLELELLGCVWSFSKTLKLAWRRWKEETSAR